MNGLFSVVGTTMNYNSLRRRRLRSIVEGARHSMKPTSRVMRGSSSGGFVARSEAGHVKVAVRAVERRLEHVPFPAKVARGQARSHGGRRRLQGRLRHYGL